MSYIGENKKRREKLDGQKKKGFLSQFFGKIKMLSDGTKYLITPQGWRKVKKDV